MNDKTKYNMMVSIAGDLLEIGKNGDITIDDMSRVQGLVNDAREENPTTELGKKLKEQIEVEVALGDQSKYYQIDFDFHVHQNEVARPASVLLAQLLGSDEVLIGYYNASIDEVDARNKAINGISYRFLQEIGDKVPVAYYQDVFGAIKGLLSEIEQSVTDQVAGHRGEIISRTLEARNPKYKKYDQGHATYSDILKALEKVRENTGNDPKDYFSIN